MRLSEPKHNAFDKHSSMVYATRRICFVSDETLESTMTCIAVVTNGKKTVIGGDSAGVRGYSLSLQTRKDKKVFVKQAGKVELLFGFTSSFRMGELIQFELPLPKITKDDRADLYRFMVARFIPAVRKCLSDGGFARKKDNVEEGGAFIVSLLGRIFTVHSDFQVEEPLESFCAVGCGEGLALGSLYTSAHEKDMVKRVRTALEAAQKFSAGVREPFVIIESSK